MKINIRENYNILVDKHPSHKSLNEKLMKEIKGYHFYSPEENRYPTNIRGSQYNFLEEDNSDTVNIIVEWVKNLILSHEVEYYNDIELFRYHIGCWFAKYNEGDETWQHDHKQVLLSFVYFVNTPKGSSPLVLSTSGKKIKAEAGKVVIYPGMTQHHVPKNNCKDRITLAGNIGFDMTPNS